MLKTLWFLIKLCLVVVAGIWLLQQPGELSLSWQSYRIETSFGLAAIALVTMLGFFAGLAKILSILYHIPARMRYKGQKKSYEAGNRALALAFTALSASDTKAARKEIKKARKHLGDAYGLTLLCEALVARLEGNQPQAEKKYKSLFIEKDTAFLGLRGLLQIKKNDEDMNNLLRFTREAENMYPNQGWIAKALYDMELKSGHWDKALSLLDKLSKQKVIDSQEEKQDRAALQTVIAKKRLEEGDKDKAFTLLKSAHKNDPSFIPASTALIQRYIDYGARRNAIKVFEATWKTQPHPDLLVQWKTLISKRDAGKNAKEMAWLEKLVSLNRNSVDSYIACAEKALELHLYSQARHYLREADKIEEDKHVYTLLAKLEEKELSNLESAKVWYEKASNAAPVKTWVCELSGKTYDEWSPLAPPHNSFNSIKWMQPIAQNNRLATSSSVNENFDGPEALLVDPEKLAS